MTATPIKSRVSDSRMPVVFVSHGAPNLALHNTQARAFLENLGAELPRPRAVLVVSAHFETARPAVTADPSPETIYDFRGFEPELYAMTYTAPGDPARAAEIRDLIADAGLDADLLHQRGFDHGTWVPLTLIYPSADIPVIQVSVQPHSGPHHHFALGQALQELRRQGVLILASGALTHDLSEVFKAGGLRPLDDPQPDWVNSFSEWVAEKITAGDTEALVDYRRQAPHAERNHPSEEHFLPLIVAIGAAGAGAIGQRLHASHQFGVLRMDAFAW